MVVDVVGVGGDGGERDVGSRVLCVRVGVELLGVQVHPLEHVGRRHRAVAPELGPDSRHAALAVLVGLLWILRFGPPGKHQRLKSSSLRQLGSCFG